LHHNATDQLNILHRIVAVLFSLADVCERLAARHGPIDGLILWALRGAVPVACRVVFRMARERCDLPPELAEIANAGDITSTDAPASPAELALLYRYLATCLSLILAGGEASDSLCEVWPAPRAADVTGRNLPGHHNPATSHLSRVKPPPWPVSWPPAWPALWQATRRAAA